MMVKWKRNNTPLYIDLMFYNSWSSKMVIIQNKNKNKIQTDSRISAFLFCSVYTDSIWLHASIFEQLYSGFTCWQKTLSAIPLNPVGLTVAGK